VNILLNGTQLILNPVKKIWHSLKKNLYYVHDSVQYPKYRSLRCRHSLALL